MTAGIRDDLLDRLKRDLVGPGSGGDAECLTSFPTDVYLTGILYPVKSEPRPEDVDQGHLESGQDITAGGGGPEEVSLSATRKPSSAGLSFVVNRDAAAVDISVTCASYARETPEVDSDPAPPVWRRVPRQAVLKAVALDAPSADLGDEATGVPGLGLHIRTAPWEERMLVTVAMVNLREVEAGSDRAHWEEQCHFQAALSVRPSGGTRLHPRPLRASAVDSDSASAALIYRDVVDHAVGHTCGADWTTGADGATELHTTWVPTVAVPGMNPLGDPACFGALVEDAAEPVLDTDWAARTGTGTLVSGLRRLPEAYNEWLSGQARRVDALPEEHRDQARLHLDAARAIAARVTAAIDRIEADHAVATAFRLMSRAMCIQREWSSGSGALVWRPFQLAFILLSLESLADRRHPDRETADLLWFPTGGGKTEAYLGLVAFLVFLRRLRDGAAGAGVCAVMRYTLRLLTTQQFQRAATLIAACDHLRLRGVDADGNTIDLGTDPISIGLWAGRDATPNNAEESHKALLDEQHASRPDLVTSCPRHRDSKLVAHATERGVTFTCPAPSCDWHDVRRPLPVWTVDTDVYEELPSLLLGTVDKFAQLARRPESGRLLGVGAPFLPPDLIIQDELHLISGPLGTLAGIYEIAVDGLCLRDGVRPKVIASTATIRQAKEQIRSLFDRETCLFPPPIIDAYNSGFAMLDTEGPARLYVGVTTAGRSAKFTLQAAAASLLQGASCIGVSERERDPFWTLVNYFNSLRELGSALVLMQDDVNKTIADIARRNGEDERKISQPLELTSRVDSREIRDMLQTLNARCGSEDACDVVLSSNMISVGVDVPRLGLMVVNGQPKGIAEYIQATSRVGRDPEGPGGFVLTLYNNAKARDRSHYETFRSWHGALYREVEATSVTPFAPQAVSRALHAAFVIMVRHLVPALKKNPKGFADGQDRIEAIKGLIEQRVANIDPPEIDDVMDELDGFIEDWESTGAALSSYWQDERPKSSLLISAERAAEIEARRGVYPYAARPTPNSMRNVEPMCLFTIKESERRKRR